MRIVWIAALATVAATLGLGGSARPDDPTDPQAIFAAARKAWAFTSYPRYANYAVAPFLTEP